MSVGMADRSRSPVGWWLVRRARSSRSHRRCHPAIIGTAQRSAYTSCAVRLSCSVPSLLATMSSYSDIFSTNASSDDSNFASTPSRREDEPSSPERGEDADVGGDEDEAPPSRDRGDVDDAGPNVASDSRSPSVVHRMLRSASERGSSDGKTSSSVSSASSRSSRSKAAMTLWRFSRAASRRCAKLCSGWFLRSSGTSGWFRCLVASKRTSK
mmetsp:Transcript_879/g.2670  ORF Transcript_879/g.2670 Transcript_879/m.2670 type:complete len:212 (+) Transcript_879:1290-1925(+)